MEIIINAFGRIYGAFQLVLLPKLAETSSSSITFSTEIITENLHNIIKHQNRHSTRIISDNRQHLHF